MPRHGDGRSRNWVFTYNNPPEPYGSLICEDSTFLKYQLERGLGAGGAPGTLHYQGYVLFRANKSLAQMRRWFPGAHLEIMRGNIAESDQYCTKDDETYVAGPWSFGDPPVGAGARSDLNAVKAAIDTGKKEKEIADEFFGTWCRNYRAFERYRRLTVPHRTWHTDAIVYWGPMGSGKSSHAYELGGDSQFWPNRPNSRGGAVWWCGYEGATTVVFDEFYGWVSRDFMCRLVDRYPLCLETKGGAVQFIARRIIITSNVPPEDWWKIGLGAMERRLPFIFFMGTERDKYGNFVREWTEDDYRESLRPAVVPGFIPGGGAVPGEAAPPPGL